VNPPGNISWKKKQLGSSNTCWSESRSGTLLSVKHMDRYLEELEWRFNNRNNPYIFRDALRRIMETAPLEYRRLNRLNRAGVADTSLSAHVGRHEQRHRTHHHMADVVKTQGRIRRVEKKLDRLLAVAGRPKGPLSDDRPTASRPQEGDLAVRIAVAIEKLVEVCEAYLPPILSRLESMDPKLDALLGKGGGRMNPRLRYGYPAGGRAGPRGCWRP